MSQQPKFRIKPESYGFLDDVEKVRYWEVISTRPSSDDDSSIWASETSDLAEVVRWINQNPDQKHEVQGMDADQCCITSAFTIDDIEEVTQ